MKYIYSTLLFIIISLSANAQLSKGLKQIGGSLSASYQTSDYDNGSVITSDYNTTTSFRISPKIGIFIKDNLSIGFGISFNNNVTKSEEKINDNIQEEKITVNTFDFLVQPSGLFIPIMSYPVSSGKKSIFFIKTESCSNIRIGLSNITHCSHKR